MASHTNPLATVFQSFTAYQRSGAMKAAIELDLFTAIAEGRDTAAALAAHAGAAERGVRILCDALAATGFLRKEAGRYALDPELGPFLDRRSPAYVGSAVAFLGSPLLVAAFGEVAAAVRRGGTVLPDAGSTSPEHPMWVEFARAMGPLAGLQAQLLAGFLGADAAPPWRILDVAAGHGRFGITLAQRNPSATVTAQDWAPVLAVADENARVAGVSERFRTLPGDAFGVDFGTGYDLVLLTNFLHHFDPPACERLLRKVHAALAPGGRAVTLEFVPDPERITPVDAATFALVMLVSTPAGDAYPFAEYQAMFQRAGFARSELHQLPPSPQQVVTSYRD